MKAPYEFHTGVGLGSKALQNGALYSTAGKLIGRSFALYSAVTTVSDMIEGRKSPLRGSLDIGMTAVGVWGGPWGLGLSTAYFVGMAGWDYFHPATPNP